MDGSRRGRNRASSVIQSCTPDRSHVTAHQSTRGVVRTSPMPDSAWPSLYGCSAEHNESATRSGACDLRRFQEYVQRLCARFPMSGQEIYRSDESRVTESGLGDINNQSTVSRIQFDRSPGSELYFDLRPMDLALRCLGAGTKADYQGTGC